MRSVSWRSVLLLAPVLALVAVTLGCPKSDTGPGEEKPATVRPRGELKAFDAKGTGTLKGKVTLDGPVPEKLIQQKDKDLKALMDKHQDKAHCEAGTEAEKTEQEWKVKDGAVQNVVVFVRPPSGHYFKDLAKAGFPKKVEIDQPHCAFIPHASVAFPSYYDPSTKKHKATGQEVVIKNNAPMNHNTKWGGTPKNPGENPMLAPGKELKLDLNADDSTPVSLSCSIHTWMSGYIWALDTPYAAVTNEKGEYEIKNVPAGDGLEVFVWHEPSEWVAKGEKMTIKEGDNTKDFKVKSPE
jgi:hypothetical protein